MNNNRLQTCVSGLICSKFFCVSSPVQNLIQRLVGGFVTLDSLHEVLNGLLCVAVYVVRAAQLYLLQTGNTRRGCEQEKEEDSCLTLLYVFFMLSLFVSVYSG